MNSAGVSRRRRVVVCRGQYCNMDRRADQLLRHLEARLADINGDQHPKPVRLEIANCLSMCGAGPNLAIYPPGEIFNHVTETTLDEIISARLGNMQEPAPGQGDETGGDRLP